MSEDHLKCWKCDYDLAGLDTDGQCPECGARIDVDRPGKENVPLAVCSLGFGVLALLLMPAMLLVGVFRNDTGLYLFLALFLSATLTIPAFVLAKKAEPPPPKNPKARPQYPIVSYAMFFALAADVIVFVVLFLSLMAVFNDGLS